MLRADGKLPCRTQMASILDSSHDSPIEARVRTCRTGVALAFEEGADGDYN